jgi:phosphorylcholine metabolism protein LicD
MDIFPCDNAAKSKLGQRIQFYSSKVIIAKALDARGYETINKVKRLFMVLCKILPQRLFLRIVTDGSKESQVVHSFLGGASKFEKNIYPRSYFEKTILAEFEGSSYPIPEQFDELLHVLYGDYMKLPPEEDRKCKVHTILVDLNHSYEKYKYYRDGMVFETYTRSIR